MMSISSVASQKSQKTMTLAGLSPKVLVPDTSLAAADLSLSLPKNFVVLFALAATYDLTSAPRKKCSRP